MSTNQSAPTDTSGPSAQPLSANPYVDILLRQYTSVSGNIFNVYLPTVSSTTPIRVNFTLPVWSTFMDYIGGFPGLILESVEVVINPIVPSSTDTISVGASLRSVAASANSSLSPAEAANSPNGISDSFSIFRPTTRSILLTMDAMTSPLLHPLLNAGNMPTLVLGCTATGEATASVCLVFKYTTCGPRVTRADVTSSTSESKDNTSGVVSWTRATSRQLTFA